MAPSKKFYPGKRPPAGLKGGKAASSTKQQKARGINPGDPHYGIVNTSKKHSSAVTASTSRNVPSGQSQLSRKANRQVQ